MGAPKIAGTRRRGPHCTDWRSWPGGSALRAAGGQPCWNAWPDQTGPLQSLQKTHRSHWGFYVASGRPLERTRSNELNRAAQRPGQRFALAFCYTSLSGTQCPLQRPPRCPSFSAVLYLTSTLAPASSSFFLMASASTLLMPSFTGFGAPSTRSLASLRPRLVTSRTALMVFTLFSPAAMRMTVNSVFSSAGAAAPAPPAPGAATATVAAAAETPNLSSISW